MKISMSFIIEANKNFSLFTPPTPLRRNNLCRASQYVPMKQSLGFFAAKKRLRIPERITWLERINGWPRLAFYAASKRKKNHDIHLHL